MQGRGRPPGGTSQGAHRPTEGASHNRVCKNFRISKNTLLDLLWVDLRVLALMELKVRRFQDHV